MNFEGENSFLLDSVYKSEKIMLICRELMSDKV